MQYKHVQQKCKCVSFMLHKTQTQNRDKVEVCSESQLNKKTLNLKLCSRAGKLPYLFS